MRNLNLIHSFFVTCIYKFTLDIVLINKQEIIIPGFLFIVCFICT